MGQCHCCGAHATTQADLPCRPLVDAEIEEFVNSTPNKPAGTLSLLDDATIGSFENDGHPSGREGIPSGNSEQRELEASAKSAMEAPAVALAVDGALQGRVPDVEATFEHDLQAALVAMRGSMGPDVLTAARSLERATAAARSSGALEDLQARLDGLPEYKELRAALKEALLLRLFFHFSGKWITAYEEGERRIRYRLDGQTLFYAAEVPISASLSDLLSLTLENDINHGGGVNVSAQSGFKHLVPPTFFRQASQISFKFLAGLFCVDLCSEERTLIFDRAIAKVKTNIPVGHHLYVQPVSRCYRLDYEEYTLAYPTPDGVRYFHCGKAVIPFTPPHWALLRIGNYFGEKVLADVAKQAAHTGTPELRARIEADVKGLYARTKAAEARVSDALPADLIDIPVVIGLGHSGNDDA